VDEEAVARQVLDSAMKVHTALGPGRLESAYEVCLDYELSKRAINVSKQVPIAVRYDGVQLELGYRLDLLIGGKVVVEVKAAERLLPLHHAQLLSYLKLGGYKLGLLLNFHALHLRDGIKRIVNGI
jgi:GxxExxY protein